MRRSDLAWSTHQRSRGLSGGCRRNRVRFNLASSLRGPGQLGGTSKATQVQCSQSPAGRLLPPLNRKHADARPGSSSPSTLASPKPWIRSDRKVNSLRRPAARRLSAATMLAAAGSESELVFHFELQPPVLRTRKAALKRGFKVDVCPDQGRSTVTLTTTFLVES